MSISKYIHFEYCFMHTTTKRMISRYSEVICTVTQIQTRILNRHEHHLLSVREVVFGVNEHQRLVLNQSLFGTKMELSSVLNIPHLKNDSGEMSNFFPSCFPALAVLVRRFFLKSIPFRRKASSSRGLRHSRAVWSSSPSSKYMRSALKLLGDVANSACVDAAP
jgi:hypothetical protein